MDALPLPDGAWVRACRSCSARLPAQAYLARARAAPTSLADLDGQGSTARRVHGARAQTRSVASRQPPVLVVQAPTSCSPAVLPVGSQRARLAWAVACSLASLQGWTRRALRRDWRAATRPSPCAKRAWSRQRPSRRVPPAALARSPTAWCRRARASKILRFARDPIRAPNSRVPDYAYICQSGSEKVSTAARWRRSPTAAWWKSSRRPRPHSR